MKKLIIALALALTLTACKTVYIPVGTDTSTNVKDSTVLHIVDSVRYTERSRYKDYGDLLKVLEIDGKRSHMRSWIDTTKNVLNGELTEDPIEEKTRIIYKDRVEYKDSLVYKEVPIEVEKIEYKTPKWSWYSLLFNILGVMVGALVIYLKVKGKFFGK